MIFFFETGAWTKGPWLLWWVHRKELLQELKLLLCKETYGWKTLIFSSKHPTWLTRAEGETIYKMQRKKVDLSLKMQLYRFWFKCVWMGRGWEWHIQMAPSHLSYPSWWPLALSSLLAIPLVLKKICPQYFVFQFNKVWFSLLCGWLLPSHVALVLLTTDFHT